MHKRIPVTSVMCGCQGLLCTVVSQQVSWNNRSENQGTNRETWQKHFGFQPEWCQKLSQDHGRISASAGGDLSGLTTLLLPTPNCDLRCGGGLIRLVLNLSTGETLRSITPAESKHTVAVTNSKQEWGKRGRLNGLLHAPSHQQEKVVDVWEDE